MSDEPKRERDLEEQEGELLPDRDVMSIVRLEPGPPLIEPDPKTYEVSPEDPPPGT
jgi:hypothetical protein